MDKQSVIAFFAELTGLTQIQALQYNSLIELSILQLTSSLKDEVVVSLYHKELHFLCAAIAFYKYVLQINCGNSTNSVISNYSAKEKLQLIDTAEKIKAEAYQATRELIDDDWFYVRGVL